MSFCYITLYNRYICYITRYLCYITLRYITWHISSRSSSSSSSPSPSRSPSPSPARQAYIRFEDMGKDLKNALRVSILFVYLPNCILTDLCLTISLKLSG